MLSADCSGHFVLRSAAEFIAVFADPKISCDYPYLRSPLSNDGACTVEMEAVSADIWDSASA